MKKAMRVLLAGFLACAALCGCGKETSGRTPVTLYEVAHSIFYAPQYAAIELGYFQEEGIDLTLVNGAGADKVMTAMLAGDADIGFMGSEASIYIYAQGAEDYAVNFAQLTQRAGNFLVARQPDPDFTWQKLKGSRVLGGRAGGMPQGEYTLGELKVVVDETSARLMDGTLAGSILTLNKAIDNVHKNTNKPLWEIVSAASLNPARAMGMQDRIGSLRAGCNADFAVFDDDFNTQMTIVDGRVVYKK